MIDTFYERVAKESEHALLALAWGHAKSRNLDALMRIVEVLETKCPWSHLAATCALPVNPYRAHAADQEQALPGGQSTVTFPFVFAHALRPLETDNVLHEVKWTAVQSDLFERSLKLFQAIQLTFVGGKNQNPVLDADLLTAGMGGVKDPAFFSQLAPKFHGLFNVEIQRALGQGNTVAVIEMLEHISFDKRIDFIHILAPQDGCTTPDAETRMSMLATQIGPGMVEKGGLLDFLDTLERMANTDRVTPVRMGLMRRHLATLNGNTSGASQSVVRDLEQLAGKGGLNPATSLLTAVAQCSIDMQHLFGGFKPQGKALHETTDGALMLMDSAIRHHCVPLMQALGPLLTSCANKKPLTHIALQGRLGVQVEPEGLKATLMCLMAHGETLEQIKEDSPDVGHALVRDSALAELAGMPEHPGDEQKIAVLLDLGASPKPMALVKFSGGKAHRERWNHVVQTHALRNTARSVLADLEMGMPFKKAPKP